MILNLHLIADTAYFLLAAFMLGTLVYRIRQDDRRMFIREGSLFLFLIVVLSSVVEVPVSVRLITCGILLLALLYGSLFMKKSH